MTADMEIEETNVDVIIKRRLTPLIQIEVEPIGHWFHAYEARRLRGHHLSEAGESEEESEEEEELVVEIEDDIKFLRSLDPAEWKDQDHYQVLGLKKYRFKASDEDIKRAYRHMVLKHHPDKRSGAGEEILADDDYFTNITKAYETLGVPNKRRAYDSVDPLFDDDVPSVKEKNKERFFEVFGPIFEQNARWSTRRHIPLLGKSDDTKQKVNRFYDFWYDFDSWREFSYLDEEEKEKGQDREERRWIEKQNKVERARRRKEEMARIRKLVDNAVSCDPRIARFKEEERDKKIAAKKAKAEAIQHKKEEEERVKREAEEVERKKREAEEAEQKAKQEIEKKEREVTKKAFKKERKNLRGHCKTNSYYTQDQDERVELMTDVEYLCEMLELTKIEELNQNLLQAGEDVQKGHTILMEKIKDVKSRLAKEKDEIVKSAARGGTGKEEGGKSRAWREDDLALLIKAVNLFPAGTVQRWEVLAEYINQHTTSGTQVKAKEVLFKAKELQHSDIQMREAANKNAFKTMQEQAQSKVMKKDNNEATERYDTPAEALGINNSQWSNDEQSLLEQSLKTYPASQKDRWDRIADCVPNRSKKDCMRRYKELVDMVKAKKAAHAAAARK
ncbi:unnamed protein product, partial [Meganyctiphanes norvegica]